MITSILSFIIAFGILVLVHEFGHFWIARRRGVAIEKFSIGFGPKIFGFHYRGLRRSLRRQSRQSLPLNAPSGLIDSKGTDFCISLIPLGGFVKMKGDEDESQVSPDDKTAFVNKSVKARSAIVMAGPFMNLLLSFIVMPLVFLIGKQEPAFFKEPPVIERVLPGSPAEKSGLGIGDLIVAFDGKSVATWEGLLEAIAITAPNKTLNLEIERGPWIMDHGPRTKKEIVVETATLPGGEGSYLGIEKYFGKAPSAIVKEIMPESPAADAHLQAGDQITLVGGQPIDSWDGLIHAVNVHQGEAIQIEVLRVLRSEQSEREGAAPTALPLEGATRAPIKEVRQNLTIQPKWDAEAKRWMLGIKGPETMEMGPLQIRHYSFLGAIEAGCKTNIRNILLTFQVLKKLVTFELSYKNLGGPVQIAYSLSKAAASGVADFLYFTAFLSIQLAVLNILPIPMLDGGHLLFFMIEAVRKRPLSLKIRIIAQQTGLVLLLTLILLVTFNDLKRLFFH
ncbi:MAG: site-2 protease family protein [Deltaproteobacteria bacterium]|nr:site-2 protease family protein [Deltaproteobacteria bacterium]